MKIPHGTRIAPPGALVPRIERIRPVDGLTLAQAVRSNDSAFAAGDMVECENGWQDYAVQAPRALIGLLHGENTGKRMIRVSGDAG